MSLTPPENCDSNAFDGGLLHAARRDGREAVYTVTMMPTASNPATELDALRALLAASELRAAKAESRVLDLDAQIAHMKLMIAKLQRAEHGRSSERGSKLIDQMELQLADLVETAIAAKTAVALAAPTPEPDAAPAPQKPARRALPACLPRERVVQPAASACPCCGGHLRKLGEDITETLEHVPAQWKVIQHVREKFSCRSCEKITQAPAPSHPIARGRAGPQLLAHVLFSKYRAHLPLNRQSDMYAAEGIDLDVSTLADWVGACAATLKPLVNEIEKHVLTAERLHIDDTYPSGQHHSYPQASGGFCGRRAGGLPIPREQLADATGRMVGEAGKDVGEPGTRVDAVEFAGLCRAPNYAECFCFPQVSC